MRLDESRDKVALLLMFLYSFGWTMALALSAPWWLWKMLTTRKYRRGLGERLGQVSPRLFSDGDRRPVIWIHAVSVGEVIAVGRLVSDLASAAPKYRVVVSTTTLTGQTIARERFGGYNVFYYPLDFAFAVRRYLKALRPRIFVLVETEFWPRMLMECRSAGIPIAVVNARISDRSYPKYLRLRFLWRSILGNLTTVLAQSEEDAQRLKTIGIPSDRVKLGGNLKYDVRAAAASRLTDSIRQVLPGDANLLVCGSTLDGEENLLLESWPALVDAVPQLRMVLAPRHPERFSAVADLLEQHAALWQKRSTWNSADQTPRETFRAGSIMLLDSIGELASVYSLATVAFVGGSLVPAGGHNPLEPAQFGVPIVMGPHFENFRGIVNHLQEQQAIRIVGKNELSSTLLQLLGDQTGAATMGERARQVFESEAGATARALQALLALLPKDAH